MLVDARSGRPGIKAIRALRKLGATLPVVAVVDDQARAAYLAGASAAVADLDESLSACCRNIIGSGMSRVAGLEGLAEDLDRARAALDPLSDRARDGGMSLHLLKMVSHLVERAIIFVSRGPQLLAVGATGIASSGELLSDALWGMVLPRSEGAVLTHTLVDGVARDACFQELGLPTSLVRALGEPRDPHAVVVPLSVHGSGRAVLYADMGRSRARLDVPALRIAATAAGLLLENQLLGGSAQGQGGGAPPRDIETG